MSGVSVCLTRQLADFTLQLNLDLPGRGVTALFGPSGSGKTSCLRAIAGLDHVANARIEINGERWQDGDFFLEPHRRAVGYVFQDARLFPHLNVRRNLEFGLRRIQQARTRLQFDEVVHWLDLEPLLLRASTHLSGGEKQRIAIGRALLSSPALLLLDEPLTALDRKRKNEILPYLQQLREVLDIPVLYVSHASDEVARLADHLVLLDRGQVLATGPMTEMMARLDLPMAEEDDAGVVVEGSVLAWDADYQLLTLRSPIGNLLMTSSRQNADSLLRCQIRARDVSLTLEPQSGTSILNRLPAIIMDMRPTATSAHMLVRLQAESGPLLARITRLSSDQLQLRPGLSVWAQIKAVALLA